MTVQYAASGTPRSVEKPLSYRYCPRILDVGPDSASARRWVSRHVPPAVFRGSGLRMDVRFMAAHPEMDFSKAKINYGGGDNFSMGQ